MGGSGVRVIGLDLSLTCVGVAGPHWTSTIRPKTRGHERLRDICGALNEHLHGVDLVVVEGPSFGSVGSGQHERGGLWWMVTHRLWQDSIPTAVVPPANLKRYAAGKGNASKDQVLLAVARLFPWFTGGNDEADALVLAAMGCDWLGKSLVPVPKAHRVALDRCAWPEGLRGAA